MVYWGGEKKRWRRQGIRNIRNNCKILTNLYIFFLFICFYRKHLAFSPPVWKTNVRFTATTQKTCRTRTKWWPPYTCHRATSLKPWKLTKRFFFSYIHTVCTSLGDDRLIILNCRKKLIPHCHVLFFFVNICSTITVLIFRLLFLVSWHWVSRFGERSLEGKRYTENDRHSDGVSKNAL